MKVMEWLIFVIIPIVLGVILLVYYFGGPGGFAALKKSGEKLLELAPDINVGAPEVTARKPEISRQHQEEIESLKTTLNTLMAAPAQNCFGKFSGFSDLGEKGTSLELATTAAGTSITVRGGAGGQQIIDSFNIDGMKLCVIAGAKNVVTNFKEFFIDGKTQSVRPIEPYYTEVNSLKILYTALFSGRNANVLEVSSLPAVHDQSNNFQSQGYLFKADQSHICFFPTDGNNEEGLDSALFSSSGANSISSKLSRGDPAVFSCTESRPSSVITIIFQSDETYLFTYDRQQHQWTIQGGAMASWTPVDKLENVPGGTPDYQLVAEALQPLDEIQGYDYFRHLTLPVKSIAGVPS